MDRIVADTAFIRRAVEASDLAALRAALIQASGDIELMELGPVAGLTQEGRDQLMNRAAHLLETELDSYTLRVPSDDELNHLMDLVLGVPTCDEHFEIRKNFLAFEKFPFLYENPNGVINVPEDFQVAIVGAGFSGIAMAVQLGLLGIPYVIYERGSELGGTWSRHKYPDIRVDTLSITYEYSFEEQYPWEEYFARGAEVRDYLEYMARKYDVIEHIRFGCDLETAKFDEQGSFWELTVQHSNGEYEDCVAKVLISAAGLFSTPKIPDIPGTENFEGEIIHPTVWPSEGDMKGKRIAIVGNGSTGVQMLEPLAAEAKQVYVFQRTAQWISPREHYGEAIEPEVQWLLHNLPGYWNWYRYTSIIGLFTWHEDFLIPDPKWESKGGHITQKSEELQEFLVGYIKSQIGDRGDLLKNLLPDHAPMLRRPVVDNGWYKALTRDNVKLVTDEIASLTPTGIETANGLQIEVDAIVFATGFDVAKYLWPAEYYGRGGESLEELWSEDSPRAYIGMMVPGFPNLFTMYGPNSQPTSGGISLPSWFQVWASYIGQCLTRMIEQESANIEVSQSAFEAHNKQLDAEASGMAIVTESSSQRNYYVNDEGRLQVNSPFETADLWAMQKAPNFDDIEFS